MPVMKGFHIVSYPIIERCSPPRHSTFSSNLGCSPIISCINILAGSKMSTEAQRVDDSPGTSGGSSDGDQRESVQQEPEREQVQPRKKEGKISSKTAAKLSTSAKRIQKELAEITLDPPPNCRKPSDVVGLLGEGDSDSAWEGGRKTDPGGLAVGGCKWAWLEG
uniref:Ubiquitin conjugating enzyme E2 E2 n=1 Tax=Moschus moschiferus TaxID=68415 RepID=A0A8C6CL69_MOSMO